MNNADLLDRVKILHGFESDTALANHLGVDRRIVSNFRQREGNDNIQKLIIVDLLKLLKKDREKRRK